MSPTKSVGDKSERINMSILSDLSVADIFFVGPIREEVTQVNYAYAAAAHINGLSS
jgi:hypothetical protein